MTSVRPESAGERFGNKFLLEPAPDERLPEAA
jgi:hypothetical protein